MKTKLDLYSKSRWMISWMSITSLMLFSFSIYHTVFIFENKVAYYDVTIKTYDIIVDAISFFLAVLLLLSISLYKLSSFKNMVSEKEKLHTFSKRLIWIMLVIVIAFCLSYEFLIAFKFTKYAVSDDYYIYGGWFRNYSEYFIGIISTLVATTMIVFKAFLKHKKTFINDSKHDFATITSSKNDLAKFTFLQKITKLIEAITKNDIGEFNEVMNRNNEFLSHISNMSDAKSSKKWRMKFLILFLISLFLSSIICALTFLTFDENIVRDYYVKYTIIMPIMFLVVVIQIFVFGLVLLNILEIFDYFVVKKYGKYHAAFEILRLYNLNEFVEFYGNYSSKKTNEILKKHGVKISNKLHENSSVFATKDDTGKIINFVVFNSRSKELKCEFIHVTQPQRSSDDFREKWAIHSKNIIKNALKIEEPKSKKNKKNAELSFSEQPNNDTISLLLIIMLSLSEVA